jgi:hypothetical protein
MMSAVNYFIVKHDDLGAAVPILVIYFILCLFMTTSFFRLVYVTAFDPPYVPLGPAVSGDRNPYKEKSRGEEGDGIAGGEYNPGGTSVNFYGTNNDPDSPGLELFYTKDVFVCEMDGKPKWCSECSNWKPDRTHHCSSSGRCIRKMDHFCPWQVLDMSYAAGFKHLLTMFQSKGWRSYRRKQFQILPPIHGIHGPLLFSYIYCDGILYPPAEQN